MYFPTKLGAKEPRNPQNHMVDVNLWLTYVNLFILQSKSRVFRRNSSLLPDF